MGRRQGEGARQAGRQAGKETCEERRGYRGDIVYGSFGGGAREESEMFSQTTDSIIGLYAIFVIGQ